MPDQPGTIDLTAVEHHPPIVESTRAAAVPSADRVRCLSWRTEDDTALFAAQLAAALTQPTGARTVVVELHGDLGAGKTTLVRHLLHALGVAGRIKSPTYAVVEPYTVHLPTPTPTPTAGGAAAPWPVWHFDFYRFNDPAEWEDAGFRDIFASPGLKLVEWPEKAAGLLPQADLVLRIEVLDDTARAVQLLAQTPVGATLLKALPA